VTTAAMVEVVAAASTPRRQRACARGTNFVFEAAAAAVEGRQSKR